MIKVWLGLHANMTGKFKGNIGFLRDMITAFSLCFFLYKTTFLGLGFD